MKIETPSNIYRVKNVEINDIINSLNNKDNLLVNTDKGELLLSYHLFKKSEILFYESNNSKD